MKKFIFGVAVGIVLTETYRTYYFLRKNPNHPTTRKLKTTWQAIPVMFKDESTLTDKEKLLLIQVENQIF